MDRKQAVIGMMFAAVGTGCTEAPMMSSEVGEAHQAMCAGGDDAHALMAGLAVATAKELQRWEPSSDFRVENGMLALSPAGKSQCADGACWNTSAILELQKASSEQISFGSAPFNAKRFSRRLVKQFEQQQRCEGRPGKRRCEAEAHVLRYESVHEDACAATFTFEVTTPEGGLLQDTSDLVDKLRFVGYPENPYLDFSATVATVSIDPTYGLNEGPSSTGGSCSASCTKLSSTDASGQCCQCNGVTSRYSASTFSSSVFLCK